MAINVENRCLHQAVFIRGSQDKARLGLGVGEADVAHGLHCAAAQDHRVEGLGELLLGPRLLLVRDRFHLRRVELVASEPEALQLEVHPIGVLKLEDLGVDVVGYSRGHVRVVDADC